MGSTAVEGFKVPEWLNSKFMSEVLSKEKEKKVNAIHIEVNPAVGKGDNYLSTLYRITAECKNGNENTKYYVILKTLPEGEMVQKILEDLNGFKKEVQMYEVVFPAMYSMMKSIFGKLQPISARCFPCREENILVLEDLQHLDYKMANRYNGLDLDHCKVTVRALARFHALSLALHKKDPSIMDVYEETFYADRKQTESYISSKFSALVPEVESWPGYEHYAEKVRKLGQSGFSRLVEIVKPKKNSLNVLNHGDCWVNNMMFHYCPVSGKVDDVRFVDFQIARFSSPVLDLQYFICNSPTDEVRFQCRDTLLKEYHKELVGYMKALKLDCDVITLEQLNEEFEEKNFFGLMTACTILCSAMAQPSDLPDLSEIKEDHLEKGGKTPMAKAYNGRRFREIFEKMLVFYEKKGLL